MVSIAGKTALVTGAGHGLGFEYAKALASLGASVIVNDLGVSTDGSGYDNSTAEKAAKEIRDLGGSAMANTSDVAEVDDARAMIDQAFSVTGKLDVLVCNAGILRDRMLFNMSPEDWDVVQRVHLRGHFLPLHFAAKRWRHDAKESRHPTPASVILTTSRSGLYSSAGQLNYAAAKAGIASMAIVSARELGRYGVRANAIAPMAATRLTEGSFGRIETMRWEPSNVAPMVAFLASPESKEISGQVFIVGGGRVEWMRSWTPQGEIDSGGELTLETIIAERDRMFGDLPTQPAEFPTATWD